MTTTTPTNVAKNKAHYDADYARTDVGRVVAAVRDLDAFLPDAIATDTTWRGLYRDGFADRLQGARVLELGCGTGLNALVMAALGADVVATDLSEEGPLLARRAARQVGLLDRVGVLAGDAATYEFDLHSFDFVVGKALLHHLTHEQERDLLGRVASWLTPTGEARFVEPAVNSPWLDRLRWLVPVPGRPSSLQRHAFRAWAEADPHPPRDNSSAHYEAVGREFFRSVVVDPFGGLERLGRFIPWPGVQRPVRRLLHRLDDRMPDAVRSTLARTQTIVYRSPR